MRHFKRKGVAVPTSVISEALSKVLKDGLSVRLSAKEHGIPKSTLQRYVNKNQEHGDTSPLPIEKLVVKGYRTVRLIFKCVD
jgi:transposase-like protein